jgi:hypothetical protein
MWPSHSKKEGQIRSHAAIAIVQFPLCHELHFSL